MKTKAVISVGASASGVQGSINTSRSEKIIIRYKGTWDGLTLSLNVLAGNTAAQSQTDANFISEYTMNNNGATEYLIGKNNDFTFTASGAGASTDVTLSWEAVEEC